MRNHTTHTRDAALLRLSRINRWLVAGSIVLTGVLADVAAQAFPGKTKRSSASSSGHRSATHKSSPDGRAGPPGTVPGSLDRQREQLGRGILQQRKLLRQRILGSSGGGEESSASSGSSEESSASSGASEESSASSGASEETSRARL